MVEWHTYSSEELVDAVVKRLTVELRMAIDVNGAASLAISGGSAMEPLAPLRKRLDLQWQAVDLTWADERCVDLAHEDSSRGQAYRQGHLDAGDPCGAEYPLWQDGDSPELALQRLSSIFAENYSDGLDVVLLGMGPDGHVASLFPGREVVGDYVAYVSDSPKPPPERMTLTPAFLAKSRMTLVYAAGESKREALQRLRAGDTQLPATHLSPLAIYTDQDLSEG